MSDDAGERTEQATDQNLREARRKGKLQRSQDITAWVGIAAAGAMFGTVLATGTEQAVGQVLRIDTIIRTPEPAVAVGMLGDAISGMGATVGTMLLVVVAAVILGAAAQGGIHLRPVPAKVEQFNVFAGLKNVFGMQSLWNGLKALLKTLVIGGAVAVIMVGLVPMLAASGGESVGFILEEAKRAVMFVLWVAVIAGVGLAVVDAMVVRKRNRKHTMMTKKQAKDEHKKTEGDPLIKSQRRSRQVAMSRNRMIAAVADSDVVVVNPTHVAVAIRYEPGKSAPRVVAKGQDHIAARIREEADAHGVPMVRDVPLARTLHASTGLGQEVPAELYTDIARVLVFVQALSRRGTAARGVHVVPQAR